MCAILKDLEYRDTANKNRDCACSGKVRIEEWIVAADIYEGSISPEIKLDGYRALAIKSGGKVQLRSRNDNDFTGRYSSIAAALGAMPDETVLDGEVVALDEEGRPSFHLLQNYGSSKAPLVFFIFDVLILKGRSVMLEPLSKRRAFLERQVLPELAEPIRYSRLRIDRKSVV